jgi:hypothetical protein
MGVQDLIVAAYYVLASATIYRGVTRDFHNQTHLGILGLSLFTPFVAFDLGRLRDVPAEAWGVCAFFTGMQVAHTAFHRLRPTAPHAEGPEILFQPIVCIWAAVVRYDLDPTLWYRGDLGAFNFAFAVIFVSLAVLMTIYMGELTSAPGDQIDFARFTLNSRSNAAFLAAGGATLMTTLFVTFRNPAFLVAAVVAFAVTRAAIPPRGEAIAR